MFLTPEQIVELTGKIRKPAQRRALNTMGITHKVRADGAVIVSCSHIESVLDGLPVGKVKREVEPNWKAM